MPQHLYRFFPRGKYKIALYERNESGDPYEVFDVKHENGLYSVSGITVFDSEWD